jgi:multiple sugar transport system permease protein
LPIAAGALFFLLPLFWMFATSVKSYDQVFAFPPIWWPLHPRWSNYRDLLTELPFLGYTLNTIFVTGMTLFGYMLSSSVVAFGFSYFKIPGKKILFTILLITLMLPPQVTMIPQYLLFNKLGWVGTFLPLIIPPFFGGAFAIFLLKQFFDTVPKEYSDAAKLDGASEWAIFTRIYLPLSKPAFATAAIFIFIWTWTDFLSPLIYLTDDRMYTLSIGLQQLSTARTTAWPQLMAGSILMTLPVLILFLFAQKTFIKGMRVGGIKV